MRANSLTTSKSKCRFKILHQILMVLLTPLHVLIAVLGGFVIATAVSMLFTPITLSANALFVSILLLANECALIPLGLFIIISRIYLLGLKWGSALLSYVVVSADGVEVRMWPYYHVSCRWEDVTRITNRYNSKLVSFKFNKVDQIPEGRMTLLFRPKDGRLKFTMPENSFHPEGFRGYPKGDLASDLARYAPDLFPSSQQPQNK